MTASLPLLLVAALATLSASVVGCEAQERSFGDQGGGGSVGDGGSSPGSGSSCTAASDCRAPSDPCQIPACVDGKCGVAPLPEGTEIEPADGDCRRTVCDGHGGQVVVPADELPDDGNPCTVDDCDGTTPRHSPQPGSSCPGGVCDEAARCVSAGCVNDIDCPQADCQHGICIAGDCVVDLAPAGSPCNDGLSECDGAGECIGAECTEDSDCTDCGWSGTCICLDGMCFILEE